MAYSDISKNEKTLQGGEEIMQKYEYTIKLKDREIADTKLSCATIFIEIVKLAEKNTNVADKEIAELAGNTYCSAPAG